MESEDDERVSSNGADWSVAVPPKEAGTNLRDISEQAVWTLSSCKMGYGINELLDDNVERYWQSDGPQPHMVTIEFPRKTDISYLMLYLDFKTDESYTPNKVVVYLGSSLMHLDDGLAVQFQEPCGWQVIDLRGASQKSARAFVVQLQVVANHQNGRDTHIRHMRVIGPSRNPIRGCGFYPNRNTELQEAQNGPSTVSMTSVAKKMQKDLAIR